MCSLCQDSYNSWGFYKCAECSSFSIELLNYFITLTLLIIVVIVLLSNLMSHLDAD